ncbi:hypothetical protein [Actinomadura algeriensis]|uniref:Zn-finger protein n=1 Tax=Actinomadura algeriensis TaxID=1679523 RepID=A0ABR9K380_9ACTN|nr:hypothetical protein [Actinomadura algeriensis]MBE1537059.1 Zn-finger protein [Actinomadura algeriensis]
MKCEKCFGPLHECRDCNGGRASDFGNKLTCSKCTDGMVCGRDGKHWKK